jgi:hypothetical protein
MYENIVIWPQSVSMIDAWVVFSDEKRTLSVLGLVAV